jgi:hypothetical protein
MKKRLSAPLILSGFLLFLLEGEALAYIDPGTGGLFYQVIILVIGAIAGYFAFFKRKIRGLFGRKEVDPDKKDN